MQTDDNDFGPLEVLLPNSAITAIYVDDDGIRYEINGVIHTSELAFASLDQCRSIVCRLVALSGLALAAQSPIIDCVLNDGTRVHAEYSPLMLTLLKPEAVLTKLSSHLRLAVDPDTALNVAVETIGTSLRLPFVAIAVRQGSEFVTATSYGEVNGPVEVLSLVHQYEQVGQLVVSRREAHVPLPQADKATLVRVAQQISEILHAIRLQADLKSAREHLITAREEERRRLRRDLHDGLGPALASLPLKIDAAIDLILQDQHRSVSLLGDVKRQAQALVADVRRVVHDLRPPALDELGLADALRGALIQLGTHPNGLQITFSTDNLPNGLPAAVEAAAYRITMEAVTNVIKHAQARHCWVTLQITAHSAEMQITIEDDGVGLPAAVVPNVGLHSMRERAEELGGVFQIQPRPSGGTRITVSLPLSETSAAT